MPNLSTHAFEKASEFIVRNARPVDRTQFEYHFGNGSVDRIIEELAKYQNDDGGFGHAIEPDIRMPDSSPFLGTLAFQVLREIGVSAENEMVKQGLSYFERTFDSSIGGWDPNGPQVDNYPHAIWWNYSPVASRLEPVVQANPGAEIVGYMHLYRGHVTDEFLEVATATVIEAFDALPVDMEFHALMCFVRLAEMAGEEIAAPMLGKLKESVQAAVAEGQGDWNSYGARPLSFAGSPDSLLADDLVDQIDQQLDFEIGEQTDNGSWQPTFSWRQYEDEWPAAKAEWAGYLTLRQLLSFKTWGRI